MGFMLVRAMRARSIERRRKTLRRIVAPPRLTSVWNPRHGSGHACITPAGQQGQPVAKFQQRSGSTRVRRLAWLLRNRCRACTQKHLRDSGRLNDGIVWFWLGSAERRDLLRLPRLPYGLSNRTNIRCRGFSRIAGQQGQRRTVRGVTARQGVLGGISIESA